MKKILLTTLALITFSLNALADDKADVLTTFENYVNDANSYSTTIPDYYTKNAKIVRVVNKKQGGQASIIIPFDRYLKEMQTHAKIAKVANYKNRYENRKVSQIVDNSV